MQFSNPFVVIFLTGVVVSRLMGITLEILQARHRAKATAVPKELADEFTAAERTTSAAYHTARAVLSEIAATVHAVLSICLMACGYYVWLYTATSTCDGITAILLCALGAAIPPAVLSVPFSAVSEFTIEKRFGFSHMSASMWIRDLLVSLVVNIVIAAILLVVMELLIEHTALWWLIFGAVYVLFSVGVSLLYPLFIAPLFNKFTPLADGALKTRILSYLDQAGFHADGVFVMDASKRSRHSNAYFTGFGKSKRVVLYDTLIEQLTVDEVGAVIAHELGHYKHHHVIKRLCAHAVIVFAVLFVLSLLVVKPSLYAGFGFSVAVPVPQRALFVGLFLLAEIGENYSLAASVIVNLFSRRDEYEADAYAQAVCGTGESLISALIKLNKENRGEISPAPLYSAVYYSHPTLAERITRLHQH